MLSKSICKYNKQVVNQGVFPSIWKMDVLPNDKNLICHYVHLIDTCGQLLESIECRRSECFIDAVSWLSKNQFGFRKAKFTINAINVVVETAAQASKKNGGKMEEKSTKLL